MNLGHSDCTVQVSPWVEDLLDPFVTVIVSRLTVDTNVSRIREIIIIIKLTIELDISS